MARLTLRDAGWGFLGERRRGLGNPGLRDRRSLTSNKPIPTMTITEIIAIKKAVAKCHTSAVEAESAKRKSHHAAYAAEVALEELTVLIANVTNAEAERKAQSAAYFDGIRNHHKL